MLYTRREFSSGQTDRAKGGRGADRVLAGGLSEIPPSVGLRRGHDSHTYPRSRSAERDPRY